MAVEEPTPPPVATPEPNAAPPMDFMESILAKRRANETAAANANAQAQADGHDRSTRHAMQAIDHLTMSR
jgi:hypothetical protein